MVANAGIGILCMAVEMSLADWRRQTAVNLDGVFLSVKYAVPAMHRAGGGLDHHHVVGGRPQGTGRRGRLLRHQRRSAAVRKSGRDGMCGSGRRDSGQYRPSGGHRHADLDKDSRLGRPPRAVRSERDRQAVVPFGKAETPQDIANGVLFLASDASNYVIGAELVIDCGITGGARPRWS
jgi:NAD(P)-dependent dehydrogenase (short-subunit alcohol dehydrogenase family)